jgi:hypothetical protein
VKPEKNSIIARNEVQVWSLQHKTTKMATLAGSLTLVFKVIIYERY